MGEGRPGNRPAFLFHSIPPIQSMSTKKKVTKAEQAPATTAVVAQAPEAVPAESPKPDESGAPAEEAPAEEYNPARLITPQEACSYHGRDPES